MDRGGANVQRVRQHNGALVLDHLLCARALSHKDISARTGLTQQAISKLVAHLEAAGLVDSELQPASGPGKPRSLVRPRPGARCALGVQLDRDGFVALRTGLTGEAEHVVRGSLPAGYSAARAVSSLATAVRTLLRDVPPDRVLGVGVGTVGPVDHRTGRVQNATNMPGWADVPLRDLLADRLHLPVSVEKDTNSAAFAHTWPERAADTVAVVLVGTGIGAGLVIDGVVYRGPNSAAGEFGHITLDHRGPLCPCGRRGCLEMLHRAARTSRQRATLLGTALTDLTRILDLNRVILLGRAIRADDQHYVDGVAAALAAGCPASPIPTVEVSSIGDAAVALGAARQVLADFVAGPLISVPNSVRAPFA